MHGALLLSLPVLPLESQKNAWRFTSTPCLAWQGLYVTDEPLSLDPTLSYVPDSQFK